MDGGPPSTPAGAANVERAPRFSRRRKFSALAVVLVAVAVVAAVGVVAWPSSDSTIKAADVNSIVDKKVKDALTEEERLPPASVTVYNAIRPAVVLIQSQLKPGNKDKGKLGTGVVINAQGDILTSLHVVEDSATINVSFADGTESTAAVKSSDPDHDIAVLTPATLPEVVVPAVLGGGAQIGDEAFAVGNPLGLVGSLSAGVISGLNRSFPMTNGKTLAGMIQFDTAVNPGNSGGPLLNRAGQVIGIVTGLANTAGDDQFIGIGFAVSIAAAGGAAGTPAR